MTPSPADAAGSLPAGPAGGAPDLSAPGTELSVRESERRLRLASDAAELGTWEHDIGADRLYLDARAQALLGLGAASSRAELLARVHPEDRERMSAEIAASLDPARRGPVATEYRVMQPDGSVRWLRVIGRIDFVDEAGGPALRGLGMVQDITPQVESRTALRESEQRFRAIFEQAAVGIAQVGSDGRLLRVNTRLCDLVGRSPEELLGTTFQAITHPDDVADDEAHAAQLAAGEIDAFSMEKRYIRKDGGVVWANLTASAVRDDDGAVKYYIGVAEDIGSRKHAEELVSFIAEAGRRLSASLDSDAVLDTLLELALPRIADFAIIDLLDESGALEGFRVAHRDPARAEWVRQYRALHAALPATADSPLWRAIHTGQEVLAQGLAEGWTDAFASTDAERQALRQLAPRSLAVLPVHALGRVCGAISFFVSGRERRFGEADLVVMRELVGRASIALENALLHGRVQQELEAARSARLWTERLQTLTSDFVQALSEEEVAELLAHTVHDVLRADSCSVYRFDAARDELVLLAGAGGAPDHPRYHAWRRFAASPGLPIVDAMAGDSVLLLGSVAEFRSRYPAFAGDLEAAGEAAYAAAALHGGNRVVGAVNCTFRQERRFTPEETGFLLAAARHAAQALDRAQLFAAERRARARAEGADRAKSQFLSTISHELRTPLNAVIGVSELLETDVLGTTNARQKEYLSRMKTSAWHLVTIIDEILTFSRSEAGKEEVRLADEDVAEIARSVVAMLSSDAHRRGIQLAVLHADGPLITRTDGGKVRQILTNLLGNALKFTPAGSVDVELSGGDEYLAVRVRDTGPGIPPERLEDIFEPFVQVDGSSTRAVGGTGLGLTICRRLARLLGGTVEVESELGVGSTFTLTLPRRNAAELTGR